MRTSPNGLYAESDLLAAVREVFSRRSEARALEPYELCTLLWLLGYTESLVAEAEIVAAMEVARTDATGEPA